MQAGEMPGMRIGADRIVKCIMGLVNGYGLPEVMPWTAIAKQLGDERGSIVEAPPYQFKTAQSMQLQVGLTLPRSQGCYKMFPAIPEDS